MNGRRVQFPVAVWAALVAIVVGATVLPGLSRSSNCGGNSAALHDCRTFAREISLWANGSDKAVFRWNEADRETRERLRRLGEDPWLGSARLLARLSGVRMDSNAPATIIAVCDTPFDNVPRRLFRRAPLAHAVAYSTGETGLISPSEFARLDLSGFTGLRNATVERIEQ